MTDWPPDEFFKVGGALDPDQPSYVTRRDDEELIQAALDGEYCNVLTARQTGKSSLMNRTVRRLRERGIKTVVIDLTSIGADQISVDQWYFGLISRFRRELDIPVDEYAWWAGRKDLGVIQRFTDFLRMVLDEVSDPIVVFIDEIDTTLGLPFTDDFFAAIRAMYNARSREEVYNRLTFILLGVASASDLITERTRTPYNIGRLLDLRDFTISEAEVLLPGLEAAGSYDRASMVLERILYWTDGHPYLTQRICSETVSSNGQTVDEVVERLFFTNEARKELNLQFIRDRVRQTKERGSMLRLYRRIHSGKSVKDEERSAVKNQLKLTGLVKTTPVGDLVIRNRIYYQVFDEEWIRDNMPVTAMQRLAIVAILLAIIAVSIVGFLIYGERTRPPQILAETYTNSFLEEQNPDVRFNNLANLFRLDGYDDEAREVYFSTLEDDQGDLFGALGDPGQLGEDVLVVVEGIYRDTRLVENSLDSAQTLHTMADALGAVDEGAVPGARVTRREIELWLDGRRAANEGDFQSSIQYYDTAVQLKGNNPAIFYDRGYAYGKQGAYHEALADYDAALQLDLEEDSVEGWREQIAQTIVDNPPLHAEWWQNRSDFNSLGNFIAVPTNTPTPTPTNTWTPTPVSPATQMPSITPTATEVPSPTPTPDLTVVFLENCIKDLEIVEAHPFLTNSSNFTPISIEFPMYWTLQNSGTCPWPSGLSWVFVSGEEFGYVDDPIPLEVEVASGETVTLVAPFAAPGTIGTYSSTWQLIDSDGVSFGPPRDFEVRTYLPATATPIPTPTSAFTATPEPSPSTGGGGSSGGGGSEPPPTEPSNKRPPTPKP